MSVCACSYLCQQQLVGGGTGMHVSYAGDLPAHLERARAEAEASLTLEQRHYGGCGVWG